jgi:pyridoxal phosphate enzyme (YggS family)
VTQITDHLANIERRVAAALARCERPDREVMVVAVSKRQTVAAIAEAHAAGQRHFGENFLQEALEKMAALADRITTDANIEWHFIGRIQSNKTRPIADRFDWVQTIDRPRVAERLNAHRPAELPPLNALIQLNLEREPQKGGTSLENLAELSDCVAALPRLQLRGLMCMPPATNTASENRRYFSRVRDEADALKQRHASIDTLSMGMSNDFEIAIECGSNCVRIGTAIFGPRLIPPA